MANIIVITKHFPPRKSARAIQIGKVVEAIGLAGGRVVVVTSGHDCKFDVNEKSSERVETIVCSTPTEIVGESLLHRVARRIQADLSEINSRNFWVNEAVGKAGELIETEGRAAVISSSTPFDSHLVGLRLKYKYKSRINWYASFSDPWPAIAMPEPYRKKFVPGLDHYRLRKLREILKEADGVHFTNQKVVPGIEKLSGQKVGDKLNIIPHVGYEPVIGGDSDDIEIDHRLAHIGHISRERVNRKLLESIKDLVLSNALSLRGLLLVGDVCPEMISAIEEYELEEYVEITGSLPIESAFDIAKKSRALLLIEAEMKESPFLPSKFVDYVFAERPILAITPGSSVVRDYMVEYECGIAVRSDRKEIGKAIRTLFSINESDSDFWSYKGNKDLESLFSAETIGRSYFDMVYSK